VLTDPSGKFVQFLIGLYEVANLVDTSVSCYYASKTYDSGYGGEFQKDCALGLAGGLAGQTFLQGTRRLGQYVPELLGYLYDVTNDYLYDAAKGIVTKTLDNRSSSPSGSSTSGSRPRK